MVGGSARTPPPRLSGPAPPGAMRSGPCASHVSHISNNGLLSGSTYKKTQIQMSSPPDSSCLGIIPDDVHIDIQNDCLSVCGEISAAETRDEELCHPPKYLWRVFNLSLSPGTKVCVQPWAEIGVLLDAAF